MSTTISFRDKFNNYLSASYPFLWIQTHEEGKICADILGAVEKNEKVKVHEWDCLTGLARISKGKDDKINRAVMKDSNAPIKLLELIRNCTDQDQRQVYILKDFHPFLESPPIVRHVRNLVEHLKPLGNMVVFVSPVCKVPTELEKEVQYLDYSLPDEKALHERLMFLKESLEHEQETKKKIEIPEDIAQRSVEAAKGMTDTEAENAFALGIVENKQFNDGFIKTVFQEKITQVKKNSLLNYLHPDVTFKQVGGLVGLKNWITVRSKAYSAEARRYGLPYPKGVLLAGVPGTGKTLLAKATANEIGFPLFQLDVGCLFGKLVGESEENVRRVIKMVDGIGRCVLFIDEIEKALNKAAVSGTGDTGTSSRLFGTLLTWLSEHTTPVFVIGTTNNFTVLPPELIRKGRFDESFWIDLPTDKERTEIFQVLLTKYNQDPKKFKTKDLISNSIGFTGAELENVITSAMFRCFYDNARPVETDDIVLELNNMTPQSKTNEADINKMRAEAKNKLRIAAEDGTTKEISQDSKALRKVSCG